MSNNSEQNMYSLNADNDSVNGINALSNLSPDTILITQKWAYYKSVIVLFTSGMLNVLM